MSTPEKAGDDRKRSSSPERSPSPSTKKLRERVSFFEKVWTGSKSGNVESEEMVDVEELERKLAEERVKHLEQNQLERVRLRPSTSQMDSPGVDIQETVTRTLEEGDLAAGVKSVKFEKITVKKTVRQVTSSTKITSRTPSEEQILDDSAYQTHSNGNLTTHSNSSSASSLTGNFVSEENLRRTPSKEDWTKDDCDSVSSSSKVTTSSSEWYSEYRTQSFQNTSKLEFVRSKSQYDNHIAIIRGQHNFLSACIEK